MTDTRSAFSEIPERFRTVEAFCIRSGSLLKARKQLHQAGETVRLIPDRAEYAALPTGTEVYVLWGGGNGPYRYTVYVDQYGERRLKRGDKTLAFSTPGDPSGVIGVAPFDMVWLVEKG